MIQEFLDNIFEKYKTGDASERTYYPALENFLIKFSRSGKNSEILVESKNSSLGIPDFRVDSENQLLLGYIEAKDLGRDLDKLTLREQEQINKYTKEYSKIIITNFIEFRLFEEGEEVDRVQIAQPITLKLQTPAAMNEGKLVAFMERFFSHPIKRIYSSKRLAEVLAQKTHVLRGLVREEINLNDSIITPTEELLDVFRKTLRPDISDDDFADMYAQTITYGLFSARLNAGKKEFNRLTAHQFIPQTIPLLKKIFFLISGQDTPQHIKWQTDEIAEILGNTDIVKIQNEFFKQGKGRDPIIHFYETFLSEYDPKEREKRGVYYTPQSIVSYITNSVDKVLKYNFGKEDGLADETVTVLDPAAGTLTFLANAIFIAKKEFTAKYGEGAWSKLVKDHILKNFYAFELLMAPYTIGHLKIFLLLKESGYEFQEHDRFRLYLTNTLDLEKVEELPLLILAKEITDESRGSYNAKTKEKILAIIGNPPYSVSSSNVIEKSSELWTLYESYKKTVRAQEQNIQPLSDDYIKFIAFAHWKANQNENAVIGMVTNNSYIDGLIHRDMRSRLLEDFNEIYILNLHGSNRRIEDKEKKQDENVFDIQQGVAILILIKNKNHAKIVKYADAWGKREKKYNFLEKHDILNTDWTELKPQFPNNFFVPKNNEGEEAYSRFISLKILFKESNMGIATGKDKVLVGFTKNELENRFSVLNKDSFFSLMKNSGVSEGLTEKWYKELYTLDISSQIRKYFFRPFDVRYTIYNEKVLQRARKKIMKYLINEDNLALICVRQSNGVSPNAFISSGIGCRDLVTNHSYYFPLYIKKNNKDQQDFLSSDNENNINFILLPGFYKNFPEKVFNYIYAILYSNLYLNKYKEFLKIDFPKVPFTKNDKVFDRMSDLGKKLIKLHRLESVDLSSSLTKFEGSGAALIDKVKYDEKESRIYINKYKYFNNIEKNIWDYSIGSNQILKEWLNDRNKRELSTEEVKNFCKISISLIKTIEIQKEIDDLYPDVEKTL